MFNDRIPDEKQPQTLNPTLRPWPDCYHHSCSEPAGFKNHVLPNAFLVAVCYWVVGKELQLSYYNNKEILLLTLYIYTPIMVTKFKFLSSNAGYEPSGHSVLKGVWNRVVWQPGGWLPDNCRVVNGCCSPHA